MPSTPDLDRAREAALRMGFRKGSDAYSYAIREILQACADEAERNVAECHPGPKQNLECMLCNRYRTRAADLRRQAGAGDKCL